MTPTERALAHLGLEPDPIGEYIRVSVIDTRDSDFNTVLVTVLDATQGEMEYVHVVELIYTESDVPAPEHVTARTIITKEMY